MHIFQLATIGGQPLGTVDRARPDWVPGTVIYPAPARRTFA
jgi:hypothetical protein